MNTVGFVAPDLWKKQSISRFLPTVGEVLGSWPFAFPLVIIQWTLVLTEKRGGVWGEIGFTFTKHLLCARHVVLYQDLESLEKNPTGKEKPQVILPTQRRQLLAAFGCF